MIEQHKAHYRARVESQDLSRLELQEQLETLNDAIRQGDALTPSRRERLTAERDVLLDMIHGSVPAPETPEQVVERLRHTNPDASRSLEHTLKRRAVRRELAAAEERLEAMSPDAFARPEVERRIEALRHEFDGMAPNPVLAEQDSELAARGEIEELQPQP